MTGILGTLGRISRPSFRRVFFSFHFQRDYWRAQIVRNSWVTKENRGAAGWANGGDWETIKRQGDTAIKNWVRRQMDDTSVTVVLIGAETCTRHYVQFEIEESRRQGKGLLGVRIHRLKDQEGNTESPGANPFDYIDDPSVADRVLGNRRKLSTIISVADYILQDGYNHLGDWVEMAAQSAGR